MVIRSERGLSQPRSACTHACPGACSHASASSRARHMRQECPPRAQKQVSRWATRLVVHGKVRPKLSILWSWLNGLLTWGKDHTGDVRARPSTRNDVLTLTIDDAGQTAAPRGAEPSSLGTREFVFSSVLPPDFCTFSQPALVLLFQQGLLPVSALSDFLVHQTKRERNAGPHPKQHFPAVFSRLCPLSPPFT